MRGLGRVRWAWLDAAAASVVLGAGGFWIGGPLGAGIGVAAGGLTPLMIERAARKQEAVESAHAAELPKRRYGPAHLLEPGLGVVPFIGRTTELDQLGAWCEDQRAGQVRLVTGAGGSGKTRLAIELIRQMRARGWRCGWVAEGHEHDALRLERAAEPKAKLLLVADYSEGRPRLDELLEAAARDEGHVRILLLARQAGDWWQHLEAGVGATRDLVLDASRFITPLAEDVDSRLSGQELARQAIPYFAARLGVPPPDAGKVTLDLEEQPRVLDLHAAALIAVLASTGSPARSPIHVDTATVLETLLSHEKHYWRGRAETAGLTGGLNGLSMIQLSQVAAAGCLLGAATASDLAERVPGAMVTDAVVLWLRELYPSDADGELGVMRPDRLAELHVTQELASSPGLAEACLTDLNPAQARRALVQLARASGEHQAARKLLESAIARFTDVTSDPAEASEAMITIANAIPYPSLDLALAHANLSERILQTCDPGTADRALWLNTFSVLLASLGQREEALTAINDAVTTYRELAAARPDAFLPDLAASLSNQSNRLAGLGRREEALTAINDAVTTYRELAAARPDAFLPNLAASLNNQSLRLAGLGRREEALTAINDAVTIRRELAAAQPDAFLPNLATSLSNQSNRLAGLGRREEALTAINDAVTTYRELAAAQPDAFLPNLATSLNNQSNRLTDLGRREEALTAINDAVTIRRELAAAQPDAFLPDLATSLNNQSACLADLGRREEALTAINDAVTAHRELAAARPDAFLPDLAMSLNNQSLRLAGLGRREEALTAINDAVTIRRELAAAQPDAFLPDLAMSLNNQSLRLAGLGRREEALTAINDAVTIRRELAAAQPDAFLPDLAMSLNNQSLRLAGLGRREEALTAINDAVTIRRELAAARPVVFADRLASSLEVHASILSDLGKLAEAQELRDEASAIRNQT